jgi:OOP family OmpA-OmpF porin
MSFSKWTWGLAPLAALVFAAISWQTPRVETDLASRAEALARAAGAAASVQGRDVTISAPGLDPAALQKLKSSVAALDGVRKVMDGPAPAGALMAPAAAQKPDAPPKPEPAPAPSLPLVNPFTLTVERTPDGLFVSGYAPGAADRDALMEALRTAAMPGVLSGSIQLAAGAPGGVDYQTAARFIGVQASRLASGRAGMSGDLFSISGETPDAAALAALRAAVGGVLPGGLRLSTLDVKAAPPPPPPPMKPYVFSAERSAAGLALTGAAPSPEARTALVEAARALGLEVSDRLTIASGEPGQFAGLAGHGLALLSKFARGRFTLTDNVYSIEGEAADFAGHDAIRAALGALPEGAKAGALGVAAPLLDPYRFEAMREGDVIVLRGGFPDEAARAAALELARKLFPGLAIRDEARIARGAPAGFGDIAGGALAALSQMGPGGSVSFSGGALALKGMANAAADAILSALRGLLPQGVALDASALRAPPAPAVAEAASPSRASAPANGGSSPAIVADASANAASTRSAPRAAGAASWAAPSCAPGAKASASIYFDVARAAPQTQSMGDIEGVARFLASCQGARAMVSGHTDGAGNRGPNLRLSGARARTVARLLRQAGAPAQSIDFTFYAWDRLAVAPEASAEDRARNRRVEIVVTREAR